jgi:hypothetical protein
MKKCAHIPIRVKGSQTFIMDAEPWMFYVPGNIRLKTALIKSNMLTYRDVIEHKHDKAQKEKLITTDVLRSISERFK